MLILTGRKNTQSSSVDCENCFFNFLKGSIVTIGEKKINPIVSDDGTFLTLSLPPYDELCGEPCNDGFYLNVQIFTPLPNITSRDEGAAEGEEGGGIEIICLGGRKQKLKDDLKEQFFCVAECSSIDFSGCPEQGSGLWLMKNTCKFEKKDIFKQQS